ncbi:MAG TPA: ankyrin repeat domain-containing protein [Candidatus Dietzia intestinipullorum]|nr:ankyrin repeat domain-containing protein [Candidatus Dietzia intestinipullorum]
MSGQSHDEAPGRDGGTRTPREGVDDEVLEFAQMLFQLAREGGTERLAAYVDAGVSADLTNERGDAFLMLAAYNGHPDTVRALLDRGADPDRANDRGQTPLAGAVFKGYGEVVRVLFEAGADPAAGVPSAVDAARMFEKHAFLELFDT